MSCLRALAAAAICLSGCGYNEDGSPIAGTIDFTPKRPSLTAPVFPALYSGGNELVQLAQDTYRTGTDLHRKFILRSCGPTNGVCHNSKEYPDMRTAATFAGTIGAPCNVQPGSWSTVFDRCERLGDRFKLVNANFREIELGWVNLIPGEPQDGAPGEGSPGLHIYLRDPVPETYRGGGDTALFVRTFVSDQGTIDEIAFASYQARFFVLTDRRHLFAEVPGYQLDNANALLAAGIIQGDHNRNGIFGARSGAAVPLLNPGKPEESYLVARLRGHMQNVRVPGSRMPLANQPPSIPDMVALMCFIEGLASDPTSPTWNLASGIDFENCSYNADPNSLNIVGSGDTWRGRVWPLLQAHCAGCHGGANPQAGLTFQAENTYSRLFSPSTQRPEYNLIQPGSEQTSYLYMKISNIGGIKGLPMPIDPINGDGYLPQADKDAIVNWIQGGALEDG